MNQFTIMIVDDHPIFRQGLVEALSLEAEFEVLAEASDGITALDLIHRMRPDVAVVDVNLPELNGQQVTRQVVTKKLPTRIVLLTAYDDAEQAIHAMRAGAFAYCTKDVEPQQLIGVIRHVLDGKFVIGTDIYDDMGVKRWLVERTEQALRPYSDPGDPFHPLSGREMEVLECVTRGMSNKEIAATLGISHQTVKNHVTSILRRLGVEDRTQAAVFALKRGWVRLHPDESEQRE